MKLNNLENLLLNMTSGLLPESLTKEEVQLLEDKYGRNWFTALGYNDIEYQRPKFETNKNGFVV